MSARIIFTVILFALVFQVAAQDPAKPKDDTPVPADAHNTSFWMQKKLQFSQNVLAALAQGDLEAVAKASDQLKAVSKVEGFVRSKVPGYTPQLQSFQFANQEMGRHARDGNLEGTAMAFHQMTVSCVACHKLIREAKN